MQLNLEFRGRKESRLWDKLLSVIIGRSILTGLAFQAMTPSRAKGSSALVDKGRYTIKKRIIKATITRKDMATRIAISTLRSDLTHILKGSLLHFESLIWRCSWYLPFGYSYWFSRAERFWPLFLPPIRGEERNRKIL